MSTPVDTASESSSKHGKKRRIHEAVASWASRHAYLIAGVYLIVGFTIAMVPAEDPPPSDTPDVAAAMVEVAPGGVVAPEDVPEAVSVFYLGAHQHPDVFEGVPCFCGCEEMLDHKNLLDCFARPDGSGWEAHALGCGVCLAEADQIMELFEQGIYEPAVIREAIIERFSDPYQGVSS